MGAKAWLDPPHIGRSQDPPDRQNPTPKHMQTYLRAHDESGSLLQVGVVRCIWRQFVLILEGENWVRTAGLDIDQRGLLGLGRPVDQEEELCVCRSARRSYCRGPMEERELSMFTRRKSVFRAQRWLR